MKAGASLQPGRLEQRRPVEAGRLRRQRRRASTTCGSAHVGRLRRAWRGRRPSASRDRRSRRRARAASATPIRPSTVATCACRPCAAPPSSDWATRSSRDPAARGRPAAGTACCVPGPCIPCATNTPNRCSVWKLVAFSGSTSARMVPPMARASARRSAIAAMAVERRLQRRQALRLDAGFVHEAGVEVGDLARVSALPPRPALPASWISATVCCRVSSMRMLPAP